MLDLQPMVTALKLMKKYHSSLQLELPAFRKAADAKSLKSQYSSSKTTEGTFTLVMSAESASGKKDA